MKNTLQSYCINPDATQTEKTDYLKTPSVFVTRTNVLDEYKICFTNLGSLIS